MNVHARELRHSPFEYPRDALAQEVLAGLCRSPKTLPAKLFYDRAGSELFERITRLPEYYVTRTEIGILSAHADEIAALIPDAAALVEFGSGASTKTRILLRAAPQLAAYVPVDISGDFLNGEAARLRGEFPTLAIEPVAADFTTWFELPGAVHGAPLVGFFPGSTIGNFEPAPAMRFLRNAGRILGRGATLILGADLVKDGAVLHAAYNDSAGVTAAFNRNMLVRINREFRGDFDCAAFEHQAIFNESASRIEMHLISARAQTVQVAGRRITFAAGERIHTENSYKYTPDSLAALAAGAGWRRVGVWTDLLQYFCVAALVYEG